MSWPFQTFLFDMGNVLTFFSHSLMQQQMAELLGTTPEEIRRRIFDSSLQWDFERGRITEHEFHAALEEMFHCRVGRNELRTAVADIFELNTSIVPVLDALKGRGVRLVLMSNTCVTHLQWVREKYDVLDRFDDFVVSYEAGAIKPEDPIYELALSKIECAPEECLYTDDIAAYVEKGKSFGLQGEVFTTTERFLSQLRKRNVTLD